MKTVVYILLMFLHIHHLHQVSVCIDFPSNVRPAFAQRSVIKLDVYFIV